ncbi:MAG: acetylglutamate kinase [Winogradskyella sp.]|uniref:acetylglutamate kinase n=1 Tax=Winogradskyella sp. TaxID=1883156 RepID=UPI0026011FE9|nr:acetylglutamate kinase [Winogradskyella sp.]NRB82289.1 acetylglutamate kinase [Winogradskyella sp.]
MQTLKIIKIGGNIIDDQKALSDFLKQLATLEGPKILVHGGGKLASKMTERLEVPVKMHNGRRITDAETLDIVTMVYAGKINKTIVAQLQANQCNAIGLTGSDGNTIITEKRAINQIDFGFVGDVKAVNTDSLDLLIDNKITPVFCAITHDKKGQLLNTNADTIASELAIAFSKNFRTELYYCFEKNGVLKDVSDNDSVIETIDAKYYQKLIEEHIIADGMLPKLTNCFNAIEKNVSKVCVGKPSMLFQSDSIYTTLIK